MIGDKLRTAVRTAIRFLDNVIDANNYPLPEIERICRSNRKIGLGVMGFADALFMLGVPYNSEDGIAWGERFMKFINDEGAPCQRGTRADTRLFRELAGAVSGRHGTTA